MPALRVVSMKRLLKRCRSEPGTKLPSGLTYSTSKSTNSVYFPGLMNLRGHQQHTQSMQDEVEQRISSARFS